MTLEKLTWEKHRKARRQGYWIVVLLARIRNRPGPHADRCGNLAAHLNNYGIDQTPTCGQSLRDRRPKRLSAQRSPDREVSMLSTIRQVFLWLVASTILIAPWSHAQEIVYLAIQGDGTASLVIDEQSRTALIIDGGREGKSGIKGAIVEGRSVLDYLQSKKTETTYIVCSHPHRDHMGGLNEIIRLPAIRLLNPRFVDNGDEHVTPLHTQYQEYWKVDDKEMQGRYTPARGTNAFGNTALASGKLRVSNFVYEPSEIGKELHDSSVIMQIDLGSPPDSLRVVDFDDASTTLLDRWSASSDARVDVMVSPHHGSRNNSLSTILKRRAALIAAGFKPAQPSDVVITVNRQNRFLHPSPEVLLQLLQTLGPDHVYVTDSEVGRNIRIGTQGVIQSADKQENRHRLAELIDARIKQTESRILMRQERLPATASAEDDAQVKRYRAGIGGLLASLAIVRGAPPAQVEVVTASTGRGFSAPPTTTGAPSPPDAPLSGGPGSGAKEYFAKSSMRTQVNKSSKAGSGSDAGNSDPLGGDARVVAFSQELTRWPTWGGVIVGNATSGDELSTIEFVPVPTETQEPGDDTGVLIRVTTADRRVGEYLDVTPSELWAAHRFVQPTREVAGNQEALSMLENAIGLVGITPNGADSDPWTFAIAPAITNSMLAEDAMRLDMAIAASYISDKDLVKPPFVKAAQWPAIQPRTYQWFDQKSKIEIRSGMVSVTALAEPSDCLMRVRLISGPKYLVSEEAAREEFVRRFRKEITKLPPALSDAQQLEALGPLLSKFRKDLESESQKAFAGVPGLESSIRVFCRDFDALRSVDRFSKIVAILNHYRDSTGKTLPELPAWVQPSKRHVENKWPMARVFDASFPSPMQVEPPIPDPGPKPEPMPPRNAFWTAYGPWLGGGFAVLLLGGLALRRRRI